MGDWKDILSDNGERLSEEDLLKYIDDNTPEDEKRRIEHKLDSSPFEADALQGLLQVQNKTQLKKQVNQLNQKLQQITGKRQRKEKRKINSFELIILTVVLLLFVSIICYAVIILLHRTPHQTQTESKSAELFSLLEFNFIALIQHYIC